METASAARPYVVGVGAANLDIHGRPKKAIVMHDSNPGHMNASAGGVTRNVCDNLARLGADGVHGAGRNHFFGKLPGAAVPAGVVQVHGDAHGARLSFQNVPRGTIYFAVSGSK